MQGASAYSNNMKDYGQFCPLAQATKLLCERWTLLLARELLAGSTRFSELQKGLPLMSPTLLSQRLRQLADAGVIRIAGKKGDRSYHLTDAGSELRPIVELLGAWGHRWARSKLDSHDLDVGLLMWDMRRSIDPSVFPPTRTVVQFDYPDAPEGAQHWWLVSENGEVDLCLHDHGYDVDLIIQANLKEMTRVWICEKALNEAIEDRTIKVMGDPILTQRLPQWLRASPLSRLGTVEQLPVLLWEIPQATSGA